VVQLNKIESTINHKIFVSCKAFLLFAHLGCLFNQTRSLQTVVKLQFL